MRHLILWWVSFILNFGNFSKWLHYVSVFILTDEVKRREQENIDINNREKRQMRKNLEKNVAATVIQSRTYKNYICHL